MKSPARLIAHVLIPAALLVCAPFADACARPDRQSVVAATAQAPVIESITSSQLQALLLARGAQEVRNIGDEEDPVVAFEWDDTIVLAPVATNGKTFQLKAAWSDIDLTLEQVNEWNAAFRFVRLSLDEDNDPVLTMDVDLTGGVTLARVNDALTTYLDMLLPAFQSFATDRAQASHEHQSGEIPSTCHAQAI